MTITQMLVLAIGGLAVLLSAQLLRSAAALRRHANGVDPTFRQVGTFGSPGSMGAQAAPLPSTGSPGRAIIVACILVTACGTGIAVKVAWDETHPDIRSAYGRAYERCVQAGANRWNVDAVERCISRGRAS